ncbi:hypothetical protein [Micromonospora sp. KC721]|uniref:hypothetical protein n=1 Tax=Micromonospora sp. KC721 TaxID=2530380 RepID=UPI00104AC64F|nr:hypothetical protein [Micromonospora sp. KC721]TDB74111.1 hypothetical protein E1182_19750 [Micromonospora sp. KC721]
MAGTRGSACSKRAFPIDAQAAIHAHDQVAFTTAYDAAMTTAISEMDDPDQRPGPLNGRIIQVQQPHDHTDGHQAEPRKSAHNLCDEFWHGTGFRG